MHGWRQIARRQRWGLRFLAAGVVAGGLTYLPYQVLDGPGARHLGQMRIELAQAREAMESLRASNIELGRDIEALREDPQTIEDIARDDLGMAYPYELVLRLEAQPH